MIWWPAVELKPVIGAKVSLVFWLARLATASSPRCATRERARGLTHLRREPRQKTRKTYAAGWRSGHCDLRIFSPGPVRITIGWAMVIPPVTLTKANVQLDRWDVNAYLSGIGLNPIPLK
jgi:hypothetical protein